MGHPQYVVAQADSRFLDFERSSALRIIFLARNDKTWGAYGTIEIVPFPKYV
jgi:hypothetical protein